MRDIKQILADLSNTCSEINDIERDLKRRTHECSQLVNDISYSYLKDKTFFQIDWWLHHMICDLATIRSSDHDDLEMLRTNIVVPILYHDKEIGFMYRVDKSLYIRFNINDIPDVMSVLGISKIDFCSSVAILKHDRVVFERI